MRLTARLPIAPAEIHRWPLASETSLSKTPPVFFLRHVAVKAASRGSRISAGVFKRGTAQQQDVPFQSAMQFFHDPTNERSRSFRGADHIFGLVSWQESALIRLPVKQSAEDRQR